MREIQSLARGLQILDLIVNTGYPQSVTAIAEALGVDKSSASRLVRTMENYGYLQQDHRSRAYTVGKRLYAIGLMLQNHYSLNEVAHPFLESLAAQTGECAHIGVYSAGRAIVTDDVQPETSLLRVVGNTGRSINLHNTAVGKGLIAFGDFPLPGELPRITPRTLTTQDALLDDLSAIRQRGYAIDDEENEYGVRCIASPVYDHTGIVVASIGISGPSVRVTHGNLHQLGRLVHDHARRLSATLGFVGAYPPVDSG